MPRCVPRIVPSVFPADLADIERLFRAYVASLPIDISFQDFAGEMAAMPGRYAAPAGALLLARNAAGEAIGCVGLRPLKEPGICEMKRLYVSPAGRGLGVGRALVEGVIAAAIDVGYSEMRLDTLPSMASAMALYAKQGFVRIAPYYDSPLEDAIYLAKRL